MNEKKEIWTNEVFKLIHTKISDAKILFKSSKDSNKFYLNENKIDFLIGDLIIETSKGWFIFEMLTNDKYEYRFSTKNKYFYQVDRETKEKSSKQKLDNNNGMYNKFLLLADYINFEGSGKGIYGVTLNSFQNLLEFLN